MPFSGGGGSSGGGSHGGSGSGGSSGPRMSKTYFPGCHRYVYYRNYHPYYIYSDGIINPKAARSNQIFLFLILLVFAAIIGFNLFSSILAPSKISGASSADSYIKDNISIFTDTTKLKQAQDDFFDTTGIPVDVVTVYNDEWSSTYRSLESYAYDYYVAKIVKENRLLIVYSVSQMDTSAWSFETMFGNDTANMMATNKCDTFTSTLQSNLSNPSYTPEDGIAEALNELAGIALKQDINIFETAMLGLFFIGFIVGAIATLFQSKIKGYKVSELSEVKNAGENVELVTCEFCGKQYVKGAHKQCPHCNATIIDDAN